MATLSTLATVVAQSMRKPATSLPCLYPHFKVTTSCTLSYPKRTITSSTQSSSSSAAQDLSFPSHLSNPTPYDIFRLPRNVSPIQIKSRYYDLVKTLHPDRLYSFPDNQKKNSQGQFKLVVQAYHLLRDPKKKQIYDRTGFGWDNQTRNSTGQTNWNQPGYDPRYTNKAHDRYGWQQSHSNHDDFYGSPFSSSSNRPLYTSNTKFFSYVLIVTWILAGFQYFRISMLSENAIKRADKTHLDAAKSLQEARDMARSEQGKQRQQAYKQRLRELAFIKKQTQENGYSDRTDQQSSLLLQDKSGLGGDPP